MSMKIYTSYHAKAKDLVELGIQPISISVMFPRYSKIKYPTYGILGPSKNMLGMSRENYYKIFNKRLSQLDPKDIYHDLARMAQGKDICLLCYEKDICDCHRGRVGEWLQEKLGIEVKEYEFPQKEPKKKPNRNQMRLF